MSHYISILTVVLKVDAIKYITITSLVACSTTGYVTGNLQTEWL